MLPSLCVHHCGARILRNPRWKPSARLPLPYHGNNALSGLSKFWLNSPNVKLGNKLRRRIDPEALVASLRESRRRQRLRKRRQIWPSLPSLTFVRERDDVGRSLCARKVLAITDRRRRRQTTAPVLDAAMVLWQKARETNASASGEDWAILTIVCTRCIAFCYSLP